MVPYELLCSSVGSYGVVMGSVGCALYGPMGCLWGSTVRLRSSVGRLRGTLGALWGLMGLYGRAFPGGSPEEAVGRKFLRQQTLWGHC